MPARTSSPMHPPCTYLAILSALLVVGANYKASADGGGGETSLPGARWNSVKGCVTSSTCVGSFSFIATESSPPAIPSPAFIEVIDGSDAVVDVAEYNTDSTSWLWSVPSLIPVGAYRFRYTEQKRGLSTLSPAFNVTSKYKRCTTEKYTPRTMAEPEALRVEAPQAAWSFTPKQKVAMKARWVDNQHLDGDGVMRLKMELMRATSRKELGDVIKSFEADPRNFPEFAVPETAPTGSYLLRFQYALWPDDKTTKISYSEIFFVGEKPKCSGNTSSSEGGASSPSPSTGSGTSPASPDGQTTGNSDNPSDEGTGSAASPHEGGDLAQKQAETSSSTGLSTTAAGIIAFLAGLAVVGLGVSGFVFHRNKKRGATAQPDGYDPSSSPDSKDAFSTNQGTFLPLPAGSGHSPNAGNPRGEEEHRPSNVLLPASLPGGATQSSSLASSPMTTAPAQRWDGERRTEMAQRQSTLHALTAVGVAAAAPAALCTECRKVADNSDAHFCSWCGAKLIKIMVAAASDPAEAVLLNDSVREASQAPATMISGTSNNREAEQEPWKRAFISETIEEGDERPNDSSTVRKELVTVESSRRNVRTAEQRTSLEENDGDNKEVGL